LIAAAHQISTRYLHKIFHDQGLTVAGWIRQRRLERCHRDLADPVLRSHPIHAIATRWGFSDSAHFSRLFRAAYGTSPRDYRHLARQGNDVRASSTTVHSLPTTS
jgi:AraC-like DNA-binding protein